MTNIIEQIKESTDTYKFIPHENISCEELINTLDEIFKYETDTKVVPEIIIDLKTLPAQIKICAIKHCLGRDDIRNSSIIMNLFTIVNSYNSLDEKFFEDERIYVSSLEEYLEIKMNCKDEIKNFATNLTKYFLSCIKSSSKLEYTYLDDVVTIPMVYERMFTTLTLLQLSTIMQKANPISTDDLFIIENATVYVNAIALRTSMSYKMLEAMYGTDSVLNKNN